MNQAVRVPALPGRGLGLGMDLRWGDPAGFQPRPDGQDQVAAALRTFLTTHAPAAAHLFFSWQARDRARLRIADYAPAWDDLMTALPPDVPRALHHTALNLASPGPAPTAALLDFTNAVTERYRLGWINEDVGFWTVGGRPVPYPLPPILNRDGLRACVRNVRVCQGALVAPLVLEFPGFADGVSLVMGSVDAYDFFRALADETGAPVTLDVAHLLSWRWWRGFRGAALYDDLDRLPLGQAFELHLSGCEIVGERFIDAHNGRLLDEQFTMLAHLLARCPNLRAVTFEDPRLTADGALDPGSQVSLARLQAAVADWVCPRVATAPTAATAPAAATSITTIEEAATPGPAIEAALGALLFDSDARAAWRNGRPMAGLDAESARVFETLVPAAVEQAAGAARAMVGQRAQRGTGRLADAFPRCVAGWRARHPDDRELDVLVDRFLASPAAAPWREQPGAGGGPSLEECFAAFACAAGLADAATSEEELLAVTLRTLTVCPEPAFTPPAGVHRAPAGWFALTGTQPPILHAALAGNYLRGPVTALVATLLGRRRDPAHPAPPADTTDEDSAEAPRAAVRTRLIAMGLL